MLRNYKLRDYNFKLLLYVAAITMMGVLAVGSAADGYQTRQMVGAAAGFVIMVILSFLDYHLILRCYWIIYALNLVLLLLVEFVGEKSSNAQRWVEIGGIRFQPSETAKIFLILFFAQFILKRGGRISSLNTIISMVALLLPCWLLVYRQPDMSTSIMLLIIFASLVFVGGLKLRVVFGILAVIIPAFLIFLSLVLQPDQQIIKDYQRNRILSFLNPEEFASTEAYQQNNSVIAIGSGQLTGKGYKNNEITSVKNGNFISQPQTDFIFAIIGEEFGFVGCASVIGLLFLISTECFSIARKSKDLGGTVLCTGMGTLIGIQSFLNIGVATFILPNTGLPLPFVSYGLTSLISLFMGMGVVMNVRFQGVKDMNIARLGELTELDGYI